MKRFISSWRNWYWDELLDAVMATVCILYVNSSKSGVLLIIKETLNMITIKKYTTVHYLSLIHIFSNLELQCTNPWSQKEKAILIIVSLKGPTTEPLDSQKITKNSGITVQELKSARHVSCSTTGTWQCSVESLQEFEASTDTVSYTHLLQWTTTSFKTNFWALLPQMHSHVPIIINTLKLQ